MVQEILCGPIFCAGRNTGGCGCTFRRAPEPPICRGVWIPGGREVEFPYGRGDGIGVGIVYADGVVSYD